MALPADRELRRHRQPAHGRAGRHGRLDRLALPAALRLAQRLRRHPGRPTRAGASASPRPATDSATSSSTGRTPTSWSPASCTPTASARSRTTCRSAAPARVPDDQLVRRVRVVRGRLPFRLECRPAFDYARAAHETPRRASTAPASTGRG